MNGGGRRKAFPLGSWCLMSTAFGWWPGLQSPAGYAERCPRSCVKASHGICSKYICIYVYEGIKGSMIVHLSIRSSSEGKGRRCGWGSLRSDWETWKKLALGRQHKCETCVWKLSLAARAVLTWTQALHLSVDLVPLPAEGILTHNHPHLAVASQHTPGLWTSLVFVLLWVVLSLTSQILLL